MVNLKAVPYNLDDNDIEWVRDTIRNMSIEEKIGQLFCVEGTFFTTEELLEKKVGGVMYQPGPASEIREKYMHLQTGSEIPLLLAANTEYGGIGVTSEGTSFAKPMLVGATGNSEMAYRLGYVACSETAALGGNWSFAPVTDIDNNFRNPIVNVRSFGSSPTQVLEMSRQFVKAANDNGIAASIKHFPGDGVDDRDQHLHITVNNFSADDWMDSYGRNYKVLIEEGVHTVMVGHIAQPAWVERLNPKADVRERFLPASLSKELLQGLLRRQLGFNGTIVSDATTMLGFVTSMKRRDAVPTCIMAGIDMFLFNENFDEDYQYMLDAYKAGTLSEERLQEALERILGLKASLKLHEKKKTGTLIPPVEKLEILRCEQYRKWARECADQGITLVKDTAENLPITPEKYKRIALLSMESTGRAGDTGGCAKALKLLLEKEGFEVYEPKEGELDVLTSKERPSIAEIKKKYDLFFYCFNLQTVSNQTSVRLNWKQFPACNMPWMNEEVPTVAVSFANPYHLYDMPRMHTFINAYTLNEYTLQGVVDKIMGKSEFKGISPVDAYCGLTEAKF